MGFAAAAPLVSAIPSAIGAVSGLLNRGPSARALAAQANDFTVRMMNSRHQWEVQDLKKAGLNPMLSAGGTPSMGSSAKAEFVNPMDNVAKGVDAASKGVHSALALKQASATLENIKQDTALKAAQANSADAAASLANTNSASALQFMDIKKPLADLSRGAGDITTNALKLFRDFKSDPWKTKFPNPLHLFKRR